MEKQLEFYLDMGIQNLRSFGDVAPVAFIFYGKEMIIHMMDFSDKDLSLANLRRVCRELEANKVIIMVESYTSRNLSGIRPSMAPDREESIVVQGENVKGDSCAIIQPFYRGKKGKIKLKKKIKLLKVSPSSRWSGILKR
jgi:hypothetical protein